MDDKKVEKGGMLQALDLDMALHLIRMPSQVTPAKYKYMCKSTK